MGSTMLPAPPIGRDNTPEDGRVAAGRIQAAVDRVHAEGGGQVRLGAGEWFCATIFLRSHVDLHLERGCRLVADTDMSRYTPAPEGAVNKHQSRRHLICADTCEDVALTGPGLIDGSDMAFWTPCKGEDDRPYGIFRFRAHDNSTGRPSPLVQFTRCRDLVVDGVTIRRAPGWTLHVYDCDRASVRNVTIRNNRFGPNTDGIGINGSRDVRVTHCDVDTGDDAIIVKATDIGMPCARVTVSNCVASSNCSALGLGSDAAGSIRDVVFGNCVVNRSLRMIQVEQWFAGLIERVIFSNISGRTLPDEGVTCERPIYVDIQQWTRDDAALGSTRDLVFHNILCETRGRLVFTAQDGSRIENVTLDNVQLTVPGIEDPAAAVPAARSMQLSNFNPQTRAARALLVADNVHGLDVRHLRVRWPQHPAVPMHAVCLRRCEAVRIDAPDLAPSGPDVPYAASPPPSAG